MSKERERQFMDSGFIGMVDNLAIQPGKGIVRSATNYYVEDGIFLARPGTVQLGLLVAANPILALPFYQERTTGTRHRLAITDGKLWEYLYGTNVWIEVTLGGGVVISTTADVDWVVFNDRLIVTDGVNQPWSWDGTTFEVLTDAPVARSVSVYYLKLFFADLPGFPARFMWSEEADETIGYTGARPGGGVFDNFWDFGQTDSGRILALVGLNEALMVFKEDTISAVRGAVEEDFKTTGVREGVSDDEGLVSARSIIVRGNTISYLSPSGPKEIRGSVGPPINLERGRLKDTWSEYRRPNWNRSPGIYDPLRRHDMWWIPRFTTNPDSGLVYSSQPSAVMDTADQGFSYFKGWSVNALGVFENDDGEEQVVYGDELGNVFHYGAAGVWDDDSVSVRRILRKESYGAGLPGFRNWDRIDFVFRLRGNAELTITPIGDGKAGPSRQTTLSTGSFPIWNQALWNIAVWGPMGGELVPYSRGINIEARGCGWEIIQDQTGGAMDIVTARIFGTDAHLFPVNA